MDKCQIPIYLDFVSCTRKKVRKFQSETLHCTKLNIWFYWKVFNFTHVRKIKWENQNIVKWLNKSFAVYCTEAKVEVYIFAKIQTFRAVKVNDNNFLLLWAETIFNIFVSLLVCSYHCSWLVPPAIYCSNCCNKTKQNKWRNNTKCHLVVNRK